MKLTRLLAATLLAGFISCTLLGAETNTPPPKDIVRGKVQSVGADSFKLATQSGVVNIKILKPFTVYESHSASLAAVKTSSFVGVTSVKAADGSQRATEIHIFPEALRGLGEGSYMMGGKSSGSRMTNGQVLSARKAASGSRMTNGSVASKGGQKLVVDFNRGKQTIDVPPGVPVTQIVAVNKKLISGDIVVLQTKPGPSGSLSTNAVMLRNPPAASTAK
jgi:hypothetical protein